MARAGSLSRRNFLITAATAVGSALLPARRDELKVLHVNTHIPQVIAAARYSELTGDRRYRDIAEYF